MKNFYEILLDGNSDLIRMVMEQNSQLQKHYINLHQESKALWHK